MFHLCAVSLLVLLSLKGVDAQLPQRTVSVQLAGNNSGNEATKGKNGFCYFSVCVERLSGFHHFELRYNTSINKRYSIPFSIPRQKKKNSRQLISVQS